MSNSTLTQEIMLKAMQNYPVEKYVGVEQKPAWTIATAAKIIGLSTNGIRRLVEDENSNIPFYQIRKGSNVYFPIREFIEWDLHNNNHN